MCGVHCDDVFVYRLNLMQLLKHTCTRYMSRRWETDAIFQYYASHYFSRSISFRAHNSYHRHDCMWMCHKKSKIGSYGEKKRSKMDGTGFFTYPHEWWWLCTQSMFVLHIFVIKAYKKRRDKEKEEIVKWEHSATKHFENHFSLKWNSLKNNLLKEERKARSYSRMRCHVSSGWMLFYNQMSLFQFLFFSISIYMSEVFFFMSYLNSKVFHDAKKWNYLGIKWVMQWCEKKINTLKEREGERPCICN